MKSAQSIYSIGTFSLVAVMSGCASHVACPDSGCIADAHTEAAVSAALSAHAEYGAPGQVRASTINHVVYLYGVVDTGLERSNAAIFAANTDGVARVINCISVSN
jgi:osmotically-inducible protein OsmY